MSANLKQINISDRSVDPGTSTKKSLIKKKEFFGHEFRVPVTNYESSSTAFINWLTQIIKSRYPAQLNSVLTSFTHLTHS